MITSDYLRLRAFRCLNHQKLPDIVHRQQTNEGPAFSDRYSVAFATSRSCEYRIQHLACLGGRTFAVHAVTNASGPPAPRLRCEQITARQDALDTPIVNDRKVLL